MNIHATIYLKGGTEIVTGVIDYLLDVPESVMEVSRIIQENTNHDWCMLGNVVFKASEVIAVSFWPGRE